VRWYRQVYDRLVTVGFRAPILDELAQTVESLERRGAEAVAQP
jgi:hypothetical protein